MKKILSLLVFIFTLITCNSNAQSTAEEKNAIDEYVKTLGPLNTLNVATIADTITRKFPEKKDKARAIFYWIANNISWDLKEIGRASCRERV